MILNSKTIALDYGSNPKIIKFGAKDVSELKTLFDTTYSLVNSLEQNLNILDTDIMTPDVVKSFSAAIRQEIDSAANDLSAPIAQLQEIENNLKEIYSKVDEFIRQVYRYNDNIPYII